MQHGPGGDSQNRTGKRHRESVQPSGEARRGGMLHRVATCWLAEPWLRAALHRDLRSIPTHDSAPRTFRLTRGCGPGSAGK